MHDTSSSKPEASFDINVHELLAQRTSFDDEHSHSIAKQRYDYRDSSMQSVGTVANPEAGLCSRSELDQYGNADHQTLLSDKAKSVTPDFQDISTYESELNVQLLQTPETTHSRQIMKLNISEDFTEERSDSCTLDVSNDQPLVVADSTVDSKLIAQQMPEIKQLSIDDESKPKESVSERQMKELNDEHQEVPEAILEKTEELLAESFTKNSDDAETFDHCPRTAASVDDFTGDGKRAGGLVVVCSEETFTEEMEFQPFSLPMLPDLALTAVIDNVPRQPLAQADVSPPCTVYWVDPIAYELPLAEVAAYHLDVSAVDAVHEETSECEHFAEATVKLPETECGVQQLTIPDLFGEFIIPLQLPEAVAVTCCEAEIPRDLLLAVESREREAVGVDDSTGDGQVTTESFTVYSDGKMPALEAKFCDSYEEQISVSHLLTEDATDRSPFDFADVLIEHECRPSDDDKEEDAESTTSEEWCVMEMEHDFGLHVTAMEDLPTQMTADIGEISVQAEKPVYDCSTQETSSEYLVNRAPCTSKRRIYSN